MDPTRRNQTHRTARYSGSVILIQIELVFIVYILVSSKGMRQGGNHTPKKKGRLGSSSPCHLHLEARLKIARGLAPGLAYIHEKKQVHGNIKPSNILLNSNMEPFISDLGLDRLVSGDSSYYNKPNNSSVRFLSSQYRQLFVTVVNLQTSPSPHALADAAESSSPTPYQAP